MSYQSPLYVQVTRALKRMIDDKKLLPGEMIPSERELSELYNVSRSTIKKSINELVSEGILEKKHGIGTFVQSPHKRFIFYSRNDRESESFNKSSFSAKAKSVGLAIENKVHFSGYVEPNRLVQHNLGNYKNNVFAVFRTRFTDDEPAVVEKAYAAIDQASGVEKLDFRYVSLYDFMNENDYIISHFRHTVQTIKPPLDIAKALNISEDTLVYFIEYLGETAEGKVIEYTKTFVRPDKVELLITKDTSN